jgi:Tfp pilus assembly protein PilE
MALADLGILLVVLALFLAVAVRELSAARERSVKALMRSDLQRLAVAQESYFFDHRVYGADPADLQAVGFRPSPGVHLVINEATLTGWSATAWHANTWGRCYLFVRDAAPVGAATTPGETRCS